MIMTVYQNRQDVDIISIEKIAENDHNSNVTWYVDTTPGEEVAAVARELHDLREWPAGIEAEMDRHPGERGYGRRSA